MAMEEMYMRDGLHPSGKGTGVGDHDQLHFNIKIKSDQKKLDNVGGILGKVTNLEICLGHINRNDYI